MQLVVNRKIQCGFLSRIFLRLNFSMQPDDGETALLLTLEK